MYSTPIVLKAIKSDLLKAEFEVGEITSISEEDQVNGLTCEFWKSTDCSLELESCHPAYLVRDSASSICYPCHDAKHDRGPNDQSNREPDLVDKRNMRRKSSSMKLVKSVGKSLAKLRRSTSGEKRPMMKDAEAQVDVTPTEKGGKQDLIGEKYDGGLGTDEYEEAINEAMEVVFVEKQTDGSLLIQLRCADARASFGLFFRLDTEGLVVSRLAPVAQKPYLQALVGHLSLGDRVLSLQGVPIRMLTVNAITPLLEGSHFVTLLMGPTL